MSKWLRSFTQPEHTEVALLKMSVAVTSFVLYSLGDRQVPFLKTISFFVRAVTFAGLFPRPKEFKHSYLDSSR